MGDSAELPLEGGILVLVTVPLAMLTLRPLCCFCCCFCCPTILWTGTTPFEVSPEYERTCLDCCLPVLPLLPLLPTNRKLPLPDLLDLDRPFLVVLVVALAVGEVLGAVIRLSAAAAAAVGWTFFEELPPLPDLLRLLLPLRRSTERPLPPVVGTLCCCACFLCSARALRCLSLRAVPVPVFVTLLGLSLRRD